MKSNLMKQLKTGLLATASGLMLLGSANTGLAQNTNPTNTFDTASSTTSFVQWWGTATMTWDAALDAANDSASGSVNYSCPFGGAAGEQFMTFFTIANRWGWDFGYLLDATTYTNLSFDIKVSPASGQRKNANDFGWLEVGLCTGSSGPGTTYLPGRAIPLSAQAGWVHFDFPLQPSLANIDQVSGFFVKMWSNGDHTNALVFNIDNFMITKPTAPIVIPPPTASLIKSKPGLNLLASGTGQYDRQQIATVDSSFGWVGSTEPVTYEMNIKDAPGAASPGYQAHVFLVPNNTGDTAPSIDWNATNLLWFHIETLANGGASVTVRYKTNCPSANNMLFNTNPATTNEVGTLIGVGNLGTINSATVLGTWKFTIANDTSITVLAPDGSSTNVSITADAAALFSGTVQAFFGAQPNNLAYGGRGFVLDHAKISTPSTTLIEDDFKGGTLNSALWVKRASDAPGVFVVPTNSTYSLSWTLPASGFSPQIGTNLTIGTWKSPVSTEVLKITTNNRLILSDSELDPKASYFRLLKRTFSKLQVLLPGETNAPGTVAGKVGTPEPVALGNFTTVTINAVDADWYIVSSGSTGTINLTSDDGTAIMPLDAGLVNGTLQQIIQFGSPGTWTVTATNVSSATIPAATSATVTVNP